MKRWNKTVMAWCLPYDGRKTDIPVTDWHEPRKKYVHTLKHFRITSMPDRSGLIGLGIYRVAIGPTTERPVVIQRLASLSQAGRMVKVEDNKCDGCFFVTFQLLSGEKFCETALTMAKCVYSCLGIEDDDIWLASFVIRQETFFRYNDEWVNYADMLRDQQRLPASIIEGFQVEALFRPGQYSNERIPA